MTKIIHSFQSMEITLIELLAPKQGEKILDLGCGTGDLAKELYDVGVNIVGVDKSKNMIAEALRKYPHIKFYGSRCDQPRIPY